MSSDPTLTRVNYFTGQVLSAADLQAEQHYVLDRLRLRNRHLLGRGVIGGLAVSASNASAVVVSPGYAIDCYGDDIFLQTSTTLPLHSGPNERFVVIEYAEALVSPVPTTDGDTQFTRIVETAKVSIVLADPDADHGNHGPGTPGCGLRHPLTLAHLTLVNGHWRVNLRGRRTITR
jgi:hypothetical protein